MRLRVLGLLCFTGLTWSQVGTAQDASVAAAEDMPPEEVIDEITVIAPKAELAIRAEIIHADEKMYDLFNSINANRDFHVVCDWENRNTGNPSTISRLKEWQCVSLGEKYIVSREFSNFGGDDAVANIRSYQTLMQGPVREHRREMREHMIELAEENPELAEAIYERALLEQALARAKQRKHE